ncbi:hypothetical protein [Rhizobium sp. R693]|uniref:hypothetical protein n=1 Tax=Rhizobium sp. R693 TaxID=1764276 RepID=UPI000B531AA2|nr:hypothetical protein [Rhizobium sp. R693]OWV98870.1 hypothetical protein ATY79_19675 [Rhizobium sp. R693]
MSTKPMAAETESAATELRSIRRVYPGVARLLFLIVRGLTKATLYTAWCLAFYILSMFRPFAGMAMLAAIVMVPLSIAAFVKPEAASGLPFWAFILMTFGFAGFSIGYTIFLDWITPPGLQDTFARFRRGGSA